MILPISYFTFFSIGFITILLIEIVRLNIKIIGGTKNKSSNNLTPTPSPISNYHPLLHTTSPIESQLINYTNALNAIYTHVNFTPEWIVYPILNKINHFWTINNGIVYLSSSQSNLTLFLQSGKIQGDLTFGPIYTQVFYKQHVYTGKDFTLIFYNSEMYNMKYFLIVSNKNQIPLENPRATEFPTLQFIEVNDIASKARAQVVKSSPLAKNAAGTLRSYSDLNEFRAAAQTHAATFFAQFRSVDE